MRLVLFDIDGTLMLTGGAGMRAFFRAFELVFGIPVRTEVIRPDGKTDPLIAKELLDYFGRRDQWTAESSAALFSAYLELLKEEMSLALSMRAVEVLPGVVDLLKALASDERYALGLVTGNLEGGAAIKLEASDLNRYFRFGGYGSDSEDRTELIRRAIQRGTQLVSPAAVDASIVIGDTPLDIIHGHAAGAAIVAVASARYSIADLERHDPDLLVGSLAPISAVLRFLEQPAIG